jgi:hypothetical protein
MSRVKYLKIEHQKKVEDLPNIHKTGSILGIKQKKYWGKNALVVKCGSYYYNVTSKPQVYNNLAY